MTRIKHTESSAACQLCIVRHGETDWNAERRLQGHVDTTLNANGLQQAEATAARLLELDSRFSALYCSDLLRTRQTAASIGQICGLRPIFDQRLRERHYGIFQGLSHDEAAQLYPRSHDRFKAREPAFTLPGGGESLAVFAARIEAALCDIAARHAGESVLIVTHGGVLDIVHRFVSATALDTPRQFAIPNAALNWLKAEGQQWQITAWADESHLHQALDELPSA